MSNRLAIVLLLALTALQTAGQSISSDVPRSRVVPVREQVEQQLTESRIRLGPMRIQPTLELRSLGYYENVFATPEGEEIDDYGGTVGAGIELIVPLGDKVFLRGTAIPEYTYFLDIEELRRFSGRYGGELLFLFNQLSIEAGALTSETLSRVNSEVEAPTLQETDRVTVKGELEIVPRFSIYGAAETTELRFDEDDFLADESIARLDRDESLWQGGIRYALRSYFRISAIYEATEVEHDLFASLRDYESAAILGQIQYDRPRLYLNLSAGSREFEPAVPGSFEPFTTTTGSVYLAYEMGAPAVISLFGNRSQRGSTFENSAFFIDERVGAQLETRLGERARFRFGGSVGENDYLVEELQEGPKRIDDTEELTAGISWRLFRNIWLNVDASQAEYDSNINEFDRELLRVSTTITFR